MSCQNLLMRIDSKRKEAFFEKNKLKIQVKQSQLNEKVILFLAFFNRTEYGFQSFCVFLFFSTVFD